MTKINPHVSFKCALYIKGRDLDPSVVQSKLRELPSRSFIRGEQRTTSSNTIVVAKNGLFAMRSQGAGFFSDVEDFIDKIHEIRFQIKSLDNAEEIYFDLVVLGEDIGSDKSTISFGVETIAKLSEISIPLNITYLPPDV